MSTNLSVLNKALFGVSLIVASLLMLFWLASPAQATNFTVNNLNDSGPGSLRQAITDANSNSAADTIGFQSGLSGTIALNSQLPEITDNAGLTIDGEGVNITISGTNMVRVFVVGSLSSSVSGNLTLKHLTVANGFATSPSPNGAGLVVVNGTATVTNSTFSGNTVIGEIPSGGGGNQGSGGGAIFNQGTLTVSSSTFSGNSANGKTIDIRCQGTGIGGAIFNQPGS